MRISPLLWMPCVLASAAGAQVVPTGFVVETLVMTSGLASPNDCCFLPDGRCLVVGARGAVWVYAGPSVGLAQIGTVPAVEYTGERGLLSIAADPAFAANGYVYVWYSSTADAFMHLDRFTCT